MTDAIGWRSHPVALECDVLNTSLVRARLHGEGIVIWRDDDDTIHVWQDRCPHRSVRLSAGRNLGYCLEGIYHGWRFGKDGSVVAVPAENHAPLPDVRVRVLASAVCDGLVWAGFDDCPAPPASFRAGEADILLRPLPFNVSAARATSEIGARADLRLVATPTSEHSCMVFGYARCRPNEPAIGALRRYNHLLNGIRRSLEARPR